MIGGGIGKELGRDIPEVPVDDFIRNCLPVTPPHVDINKILTKLKSDRRIGAQGSWLSSPDPSRTKKIETNAFKPFKRILDVIAECVADEHTAHGHDSTPTLEFVDNPLKAPFSERGNQTRPDVYSQKIEKSVHSPKKENTEEPAKAKALANAKGKAKASANATRQVSTSSLTSQKNAQPADHWDDICNPFEFKKKETEEDIADVSLHLLSPLGEKKTHQA